MPLCRLVDEEWNHLADFEAPDRAWVVGDEFTTDADESYAIVAIVPTDELETGYAATWTVEPS